MLSLVSLEGVQLLYKILLMSVRNKNKNFEWDDVVERSFMFILITLLLHITFATVFTHVKRT